MKRTIWILAVFITVLAVLFAGCTGSAAPTSDLLSVRNRETGKTITIGDSRQYVISITGPDENHVTEFMEDGVERVEYWDALGLLVDYLDDKVVAFRLLYDGDWELMNGVHVGMPKAEAEKLYEGIAEREVGQKGGIMISYDENQNPIPLDEFSPYFLRISYTDDGTVDIAVISYNF